MRKRLVQAICVAAVRSVDFYGDSRLRGAIVRQPGLIKISDATITAATPVPAGPWTPPAAPGAQGPPGGPRPIDLPAFCACSSP